MTRCRWRRAAPVPRRPPRQGEGLESFCCLLGYSLGRDDQGVAVERRLGEFGEDLAPDQYDDTVADVEIGELVAAEQHTRPRVAGDAGQRAEQQLLGRDVDAAGRRD